jgi:PAS domain S-box-containing protein
MRAQSHLTTLAIRTWLKRKRPAAQLRGKKVRYRFVVALVLLLVIGALEYEVTRRLRQTELWESRIETALDKLESISSQLKDAETGQRGYVITGDERYLKSYRAARQSLYTDLEKLRVLTADNAGLRAQVDALMPAIVAKLDAMREIYRLRQNPGFDPATQVVLIEQGQQLMDDTLQMIDKLREEQDVLLGQTIEEAEARNQTINVSVTFGSLVAILLAIFMIGRDIVERKRADAALRESAARFHRLAENAMDMIYRYRRLPTPGVEYVSPAAMAITGYTCEDFYADAFLLHRIVHPDDRPLLSLRHPEAAMPPLTVRWLHKNGAVIWTSQQMVSVLDANGNVVAIEGIVRDITERVQAYQILEQRVEERTHEIERRREVAEGLRDILTILNSNHSLAEILDAIVAQACRLLDTNAGAVYRLDKGAQQLSLQAARGLKAADAATYLPGGQGPLGEVVQTCRPLAVGDIAAAMQEAASVDRGSGAYTGMDALYRWYSALLVVPLMVKNEVYGTIILFYEEPRDFSGEDIEIAMTFGDQAALAIENARLRVQAEQMAVAAERSRLARDLHDAVTQTLFSTSLIADVLPRLWITNRDEAKRRLDELRHLTRGALAEMRALLLELRPSSLIETGLHELLRQLAEATTGRARIPVTLVVEGQCDLAPDVQIGFYRIAQEALNNVARHAGASQATVHLCCRDAQIELHICDDGQGFDPSSVAPQHLGLGIMRERAEAIGATLRIESEPGCGARVGVVWPLNEAAPDGRSSRSALPSVPANLLGGGHG